MDKIFYSAYLIFEYFYVAVLFLYRTKKKNKNILTLDNLAPLEIYCNHDSGTILPTMMIAVVVILFFYRQL
jgi:hypothetical protein